MRGALLFLFLLAVPPAWADVSVCQLPPAHHPTDWKAAEFYQENLSPGPPRELAVVAEFLAGNFPDRLRQFETIFLHEGSGHEALTISLKVAPDYLMVGSDQDGVRAPLAAYSAQYVASQLGMVLPTAHIVDLIYEQAETKLEPQPTDWWKRDWQMRYGPNYLLFQQMVEGQRQGRVGLIAGHKKDLVITNLLDRAIDRVAIYGWQRPGNRPIQPLSTVHANWYEDYSHGVRLIAPFITITDASGRTWRRGTVEALKDPVLGNILNGHQGPLRDVRAARQCPEEFLVATGLKPENCPPQPQVCAYRGD